MNELSDNLLDLARGCLPGSGAFTVEPIEKGGSDRRFFRIRAAGGDSLIAVSYSEKREENRHYVDIGRFLDACGVRVPKVFLHDAGRGLIFMEDLGEVDLWQWREAPWEVRRPLYESALGQVARMHGEATRRFEGSGLNLQREFGEQLYLWEQEYFTEHCLQGVFHLPVADARSLVASTSIPAQARTLATLPRVLVHRDFQSQNILIRRQEACLIDFQGMRPGLPHYDVASLLYDPYVSLDHSERCQLLDAYLVKAAQEGIETGVDFGRVLDQCAAQRLMQAMGAYGFLGLHAGKPHFLGHIPAGQRALRTVLKRLPGMEPLAAFLETARA